MEFEKISTGLERPQNPHQRSFLDKLKDLSYEELLELYQEEVNFVSYLEEMYTRVEGDKDE